MTRVLTGVDIDVAELIQQTYNLSWVSEHR